MAHSLASSAASSLPIALIGFCGLPAKTSGTINVRPSSSISGGGTGNGWARPTVARASLSSAGRPELCVNLREINLPERSSTKVTFATPLCPLASSGNLLLAFKRYSNSDNDPRGPWRSVPFSAQGYRKNQMYKIVTPTGFPLDPPKGRSFRTDRKDISHDEHPDHQFRIDRRTTHGRIMSCKFGY
jgi:hypothetical protein